ncbi:MAG: sigma factor, partial [Pyrinomonadaceae bacterium]
MFGIGRKRKKDWAAFEAEALPLMADVFRVANYLARDHETAEDLTQETFAQALQSFHRYTPGTNCRA